MLCGVSTNIGIPGSALAGVNRGYQVIVPEDCTAGAWPEAHDFQITHTLPLMATVTTSAELLDAMSWSAPVLRSAVRPRVPRSPSRGSG